MLQGSLLIELACAAAVFAGCAGEMADPTESSSESSAITGKRDPKLTPQTSGTTNRLQAVSPVNSRVVWASGLGGTYTVTTDGGKTWTSAVVPGAETLQFRDVEAVSAREAYLLSAGVGTDSRIYKTVNGGATWTLQFQNQDPNGFYDCFAFWTSRRGITMADSIDGRFPVIRTTDGRTWTDIGDNLPAALAGESAFAASGTCVATQGRNRAWIATGAAERARVLATTDGGDTWAAFETPIVQGTASSGGFSIAFRDRRHGILGGGELATPTELADNFARSSDGGHTWRLGTQAPIPGAIFGLAYALGDRGNHGRGDDDDDQGTDDDDDGHGHGHDRVTVVATGPGGASLSRDEGDTWVLLDGVTNFWAVAFADARTGWLVGTEGRILKIEL
jgi:photosystem II stability/assembly factor-like uncharacterized protein